MPTQKERGQFLFSAELLPKYLFFFGIFAQEQLIPCVKG